MSRINLSEKILITNSEDETFNFGREFSKNLKAGSIILLHGDLGTGKTVFVRGACAGFGVKRSVRSPSFTLINEYKTQDEKFLIVHADLYRLDKNNVSEIGIEEYANSDDVILFIEWPDRLESVFENAVNIYFRAIDEFTREIRIKS